MERLGTLTAAISVEGMCETTDRRREEGAFDRALGAMSDLWEEKRSVSSLAA
jgi:MoaA/NifB/PqqE/SkfB family radical SAM enzyme